ncbi:MAG: IS30 family transposase [Pseudobacteriovorax sp.]|nr:IS30 family transposase [Pseudobacteriovorax sp.]
MNKAGKSQIEIAQAIGFTQGTVSKELRRNRGKRGYRYKQAQSKADNRSATKRSRAKIITGDLKTEIHQRLRRKHSPEQISGNLKLQKIFVSHECIYSYIAEDKRLGGDLYTHLRINGKRRYKHRNKAGRVGKILNRKGIEQRPKVVDARMRYGDWEVDLIEGKKGSGYLVSLYERKSLLGKLQYIPTKGARETGNAMIQLLKDYKVHTITYDNGLEFADHQRVCSILEAEGYFCNPYHSWEKGGVENFNGLVRQYFPKGSDFGEISSSTLRRVEDEINQRPRKTHNYKSPSELEPKIREKAA